MLACCFWSDVNIPLSFFIKNCNFDLVRCRCFTTVNIFLESSGLFSRFRMVSSILCCNSGKSSLWVVVRIRLRFVLRFWMVLTQDVDSICCLSSFYFSDRCFIIGFWQISVLLLQPTVSFAALMVAETMLFHLSCRISGRF